MIGIQSSSHSSLLDSVKGIAQLPTVFATVFMVTVLMFAIEPLSAGDVKEKPDDSFPKDLKALQKLLLSMSLDSNRPTIVIGKSTDASCELFWMMNLVVKAVMGRATMARLSSILDACLSWYWLRELM
ncbi:hypothetical protein Aduo_005413 [Ancylostoma duodenale]